MKNERFTVEVVITEEGEMFFHVKGRKGASCASTAAEIARLLDMKVVAEQRTPEYYEDPVKIKPGGAVNVKIQRNG